MHDKNGHPLKVGDRVTVEFEIVEVAATEEFCNANLKTVEPMYPSDRRDSYWLNTKQTVKVQ